MAVVLGHFYLNLTLLRYEINFETASAFSQYFTLRITLNFN
jgi:hypothetical protein